MTGSLRLHSSSQLASGILPMTAAALLHAPLCGWCCAVQCHENLTFSCRCSMLEIYNEVITDLINPAGTNLQIREDIKRGCYVEDLSEHTVQNGTQHRHSTTSRLPAKQRMWTRSWVHPAGTDPCCPAAVVCRSV